jgi:hypothetical protein
MVAVVTGLLVESLRRSKGAKGSSVLTKSLPKNECLPAWLFLHSQLLRKPLLNF